MSASVSFQTATNYQPGNAVAGDFASNNPRAVVLAGPGGLVAGTGGVTVGSFGWVQSDGITVLATGTTTPAGFISRQDMAAIIQTYGAGYGNNIPAGFGVTLYNAGDFWAFTTSAAVVGNTVYVSETTGAIQCAAVGSPPVGYIATSFLVASAGTANSLIKISSRTI